MITEAEARAIAADWHSGQSSALYAFSSSGYVDSLTELELERVVSECERRVERDDWVGNMEAPTTLLEQARGALEYVRHNLPTARAYRLGAEHATNAASWIVDGNTKTEFIPAVLELFDAGDPAVDDYLPARPNLSGEWADNPTPGSLYEEITGRDAHGDATWDNDSYQEALEELCDAYEQGVSDTFYAECERILRAAL